MTKVKIVDMEKCIGCELCEKVCEFLNSKPRSKVTQTGDGVLVPITCLHCTTPVCVEVCPTGAAYRGSNGSISLRMNRCVGCKLCVAACPFGVPEVEPGRSFMRKCDLCQERTKDGLEPACTMLCPAGAIIFKEYEDAARSGSATVRLLLEKRVIRG